MLFRKYIHFYYTVIGKWCYTFTYLLWLFLCYSSWFFCHEHNILITFWKSSVQDLVFISRWDLSRSSHPPLTWAGVWFVLSGQHTWHFLCRWKRLVLRLPSDLRPDYKTQRSPFFSSYWPISSFCFLSPSSDISFFISFFFYTRCKLYVWETQYNYVTFPTLPLI